MSEPNWRKIKAWDETEGKRLGLAHCREELNRHRFCLTCAHLWMDQPQLAQPAGRQQTISN